MDDSSDDIFSNHIQDNNYLSDSDSEPGALVINDMDTLPAPVAVRIVSTNNNTNGRVNPAVAREYNSKLRLQIVKAVKRPGKSKYKFVWKNMVSC